MMASPTAKETIDKEEARDIYGWHDTAGARQAWVAEKETGFWEAIKTNRRAVFWSAMISMSLIMEGYDTALVTSFFAYPTFQRKYGEYFPSIQQYQLTGAWQAGLSDAQVVGLIIGGLINGWSSSRFGYKPTMLAALLVLNATLFTTFFAPSAGVLLAGQLLNGIPWGVFATVGPAYASEVLPLALRGYLTVFCNLCWATGQLIANGVLQGLVTNPTEWSYRIPFGLQWIWPLPLSAILLFAPESPWFLVRRGRHADAAAALRRLADKSDGEARATLAQMRCTVAREAAEARRRGDADSSYLDCLRGADRRRTEICCVAWAGQMLSGAIFAYSATYFFTQAGLAVADAYKIGVATNALSFLGTVLSWFLMAARAGRRAIYVGGAAALAAVLLVIGVVSATSPTATATTDSPAAWAQAALLLVWHLVYSLTLGPVTYAIVAETSAVRLRARTVVLARCVYNVTLIVAAVLGPYMINPSEWNWQGRAAFFWCGGAALTAVWAYFRLPETKGRSYEELDMLFSMKVPARKFSSTKVTVYEEDSASGSKPASNQPASQPADAV
ncbi:general substrate transporter [Biscogniauxia mediterranea]|nr:general substrate transporter [Biscogniauxia mediterranea]